MHRLFVVGSLLFAGCSSPPPPVAPKVLHAVELKVVKWPELQAALAAQKGKVLVVDVWADYCLPCKKEFAHLVEMHEKYAKDGLVCMSVSVDQIDNRDNTLKFLKKKNSTLLNFLIDEPGEVWEKELDSGPPPTVLVFGRDGKRAKKFTTEVPFTYADVEKVVTSLLN